VELQQQLALEKQRRQEEEERAYQERQHERAEAWRREQQEIQQIQAYQDALRRNQLAERRQ
jgi:hypothetical protein